MVLAFGMMHQVPTFSLYGDAQSQGVREFIHIEEISARSAARNWQIDAHRHEGLFQLLFVFSGTARVLLDSDEREYGAPMAVIIPPGAIHAFKFMPRTEGYVLTLDDAGIAGTAGADDTALTAFSAQREAAVIPLGEQDGMLANRVRAMLAQIDCEFASPGLASSRMFVWLVRALLLLLEREQIAHRSSATTDDRHAALFKRFRELVDRHYAEHWSIERYAQELNITESRLNRLCRRETGNSAFALIQARLLLEARRMLVFTAIPVSQLAYELGFSDPAYFTRLFKKDTGVAPGSFRAQSRHLKSPSEVG